MSEAHEPVSLNAFGHEFRMPKSPMMFLKPFFNFEQGETSSNWFIRLHHELPDSGDVRECAKKHWESRTTLLCRKGHVLVQWTATTPILCFSCNDNWAEGEHWVCSGKQESTGKQERACVMHICNECMVTQTRVKRKRPLAPDPTPSPLPAPNQAPHLPPPTPTPGQALFPAPPAPPHVRAHGSLYSGASATRGWSSGRQRAG